jgi:Tol biopolymer transport system component
VTTNPERDVSPAWRPDGSQIAFARLFDRSTAIYVASALGGSEQKIAEFPASRMHTAVRNHADPLLSWSPDGRWLVLSRVTADENSGLHLIAQNGSERHTLLPASPTNNYTAAAFSPRGNALAYADSGYIGVVEIDPGAPTTLRKAPRRVTEFQGYIFGVAWTNDGKEVLYGRAPYAAPPAPYLWRVAVDGSSAPRRIDLAGVASFPSLSASGRLAFGRRELNVDMRVLRAGREPTIVAASTFNEFDASFSPDGSKIAFSSDRTGEGNEIWIVNSDGTGRRPVTSGVRRPEGSPRWSPDGRRLAFDGLGDDGMRHVYVVDEAGGAIKPLPSKPGSNDQLPSWSRDGKWVYFGSDRSGTFEVWRIPLDGGEPQQVTRNGGAAPFESWDGRTLYFSKPTKGGRTLFAQPLDGSPQRALGIDVTFWNYAVGPRGLYYTTIAEGRRAPYSYDIRLFDDSGKTTLIHRVQQATMSPGLSVTSDGQSILIAGVAEMRQDLFLIENFR